MPPRGEPGIKHPELMATEIVVPELAQEAPLSGAA